MPVSLSLTSHPHTTYSHSLPDRPTGPVLVLSLHPNAFSLLSNSAHARVLLLLSLSILVPHALLPPVLLVATTMKLRIYILNS